ncbi:MAG: PDR/VanB family oxidoreductase [Rhodanobacteraceae bacterium]
MDAVSHAGSLDAVVTERHAVAKDTVSFELRAADAGALPSFQPGAHVDVELPNGLVRQYSLLNDSREHARYVIGVLREPPGRGTGGSEYVHRMLTVGTALKVSAPINNFKLEPADSYRFVAGGIGITPIVCMIRWCVANMLDWSLVYAARSRCRTAFYEELSDLDAEAEHIRWHFDDEAGGYLNVERAVSGLSSGELVYCCGPRPLMGAVRSELASQPGVARFESFVTTVNRSEGGEAAGAGNGSGKSFTIVLKRSNVSFEVPADKSILEVLEENGFSVPFSCREGECGTCVTPVCEGLPEHRGYVLSDDERASNKMMCLCVSRALSEGLVLDL